MANNITLSDIMHSRPDVSPTVYGYVLPDVSTHKGYIKVGYTTREAKIRVKEQLHTSAVAYKILFKESAVRSDGTVFTDDDVHRVLKRKGFPRLNEAEDKNEWYKCSVEDVLSAINEVRTGVRTEGDRTWTFSMREEQKMAVDMTKEYYISSKKTDPTHAPKFLWNAKMRFGKTFATYQLAKEMNFKKILIMTFKPAVETAWQEDLARHVDFKGWQFVSNKEAKFDEKRLDEQFEACDKEKPIVVFGSFQDLLGTNSAGGIKTKNEFIHSTNWDMVVFDEYHFGAWRENAKNLFEKFDEEDNDFDPEEYQKKEAGNAINETFLPISAYHYLYLSGTPFRALKDGEFLEDNIFNWTYSDEQAAKENWKGEGENPYLSLPKMIMMAYKVPDSIVNVATNEGFDGFDINEFFKAECEEKGKEETARFVYEDYVQNWIKMIQGKYMPQDGLKMGSERPPMPFSDVTLLNVLSHTLWYLPNVASCYAMRNLLRQRQNNFFDDYKVIVCAGKSVAVGAEALPPVLNAMGDPLKTKTITLSCGKLCTGVTVRPWTGIFMLRNLKSPETYFQTIFRVQSPWEMRDENGDRKIIKKECYVFDFALERMLKEISDYAGGLKIDGATQEQKVEEIINFLPVLAFAEGSSMTQITAQDILDITYAGTSATLLAKRWQTALLVHVDDDTLKKLRENSEAMEALMKIEGFRSLNAEIETIINRSEKVKKLKKEKGDNLSKSEKKEMSEDEKKAKSIRKQVQEKLLKLASRIPAFMYLTDYREQTLKDVITQIEPELFKKVTGLTVKDFDVLCSIGLFDPDKMNQGIFGFRKYEDSSLSYMGIDMHEGENVGGWDTTVLREEYDVLFSQQQSAVVDFSDTTAKGETQKEEKVVETNVKKQEQAEEKTQEEKEIEKLFDSVNVGVAVAHKSFGNGIVTWVDNDKRYIRVKFSVGEKTFVFPECFINGFLKVE